MFWSCTHIVILYTYRHPVHISSSCTHIIILLHISSSCAHIIIRLWNKIWAMFRQSLCFYGTIITAEHERSHQIFTKNKSQLVAQYSCLFVRSPTCFSQIYWPSAGGHVQWYFNVELSHVVTTVCVFIIIKIIKIGL